MPEITAEKKIILLAAGDTVYVFAEDNAEAADMQYTVLIGANLDVTRAKITEERWPQILEALGTDEIEIVDTRTPPTDNILRDTMAALQDLGDAVTHNNREAYRRALKHAIRIGVTEAQILDAYNYRNDRRMSSGMGAAGFDIIGVVKD